MIYVYTLWQYEMWCMCTHYGCMKYDVCVHIMAVWNVMYVYEHYGSMKCDVYTLWQYEMWCMCTHYGSMKCDVCVHIMIVWNMMYVYTLWQYEMWCMCTHYGSMKCKTLLGQEVLACLFNLFKATKSTFFTFVNNACIFFICMVFWLLFVDDTTCICSSKQDKL